MIARLKNWQFHQLKSQRDMLHGERDYAFDRMETMEVELEAYRKATGLTLRKGGLRVFRNFFRVALHSYTAAAVENWLQNRTDAALAKLNKEQFVVWFRRMVWEFSKQTAKRAVKRWFIRNVSSRRSLRVFGYVGKGMRRYDLMTAVKAWQMNKKAWIAKVSSMKRFEYIGRRIYNRMRRESTAAGRTSSMLWQWQARQKHAKWIERTQRSAGKLLKQVGARLTNGRSVQLLLQWVANLRVHKQKLRAETVLGRVGARMR